MRGYANRDPNTPPLWRMRGELFIAAARRNWRMFASTRIGLVGLAIIAMYAVLAIIDPLLMATVWDPAIYDPVIGYAFDETIQPAGPAAPICWAPTLWAGMSHRS